MARTLNKTMKSVSIFALVLGAAIGILSGMAVSAEIHCGAYCQGTNGADDMYGTASGNTMDGRDGRDNLWAYAAVDEVIGGDDADNVNGGENTDYVFGHPGNDSYWVVGSNKGVYGQSGADILYGGYGEDFLEGNASQDQMYGNEHNDVFFAEDGVADGVDGNGGINQCYVDGYDAWSNCTPH